MTDDISEWVNEVHCGDTFDVLPQIPESSVHAVVTDPPYGLAFMGRDWDDFEPKEYQEWCEEWAVEAKRVLKPGGHLIAFSGNRTHHRLFTGVEDAGFEVRDTITWHYGTGFPKGADVAKFIDDHLGESGEYVGDAKEESGPNRFLGGRKNSWRNSDGSGINASEYQSATEVAAEWAGWNTQLKPATEFVVLARKPLSEDTVAGNVLEHGTGALNIGGCRIGTEERVNDPPGENDIYSPAEGGHGRVEGRYPANVVFDEEVAAELDADVGDLGPGCYTAETGESNVYGDKSVPSDPGVNISTGDSGGPSRYFYTSKASRSERTLDGKIENAHPTVKPQDLMEWLVRLSTCEGQVVLDPFAGTGTTAAAARELYRDFVAIERDEQWADVARARIGIPVDDPSRFRDEGQSGVDAFLGGGDE